MSETGSDRMDRRWMNLFAKQYRSVIVDWYHEAAPADRIVFRKMVRFVIGNKPDPDIHNMEHTIQSLRPWGEAMMAGEYKQIFQHCLEHASPTQIQQIRFVCQQLSPKLGLRPLGLKPVARGDAASVSVDSVRSTQTPKGPPPLGMESARPRTGTPDPLQTLQALSVPVIMSKKHPQRRLLDGKAPYAKSSLPDRSRSTFEEQFQVPPKETFLANQQNARTRAHPLRHLYDGSPPFAKLTCFIDPPVSTTAADFQPISDSDRKTVRQQPTISQRRPLGAK
eukprot:NODE_1173_length_1063_cov_12.500986_g897_i0.p1 GENE.NODE_1173_length_1063_cov_12.500986_g897_i0~~NODE_1173_length_1063_cov_12.500986_g897_i0.p1  ORF type:complete len:309 (+),score=62.23 NODE_1173_length_1063_cov_12.500986_g897_i0:89-928(+)